MLVKSIRGSIKYNGNVYFEGEEFEIEERHLVQMQENVEVISKAKDPEKDVEVSIESETLSNSEKVDYKNLKKAELLEIAKGKGIEIPEKATSADIIELLQGE